MLHQVILLFFFKDKMYHIHIPALASFHYRRDLFMLKLEKIRRKIMDVDGKNSLCKKHWGWVGWGGGRGGGGGGWEGEFLIQEIQRS